MYTVEACSCQTRAMGRQAQQANDRSRPQAGRWTFSRPA